jgi:hypothetical protein
VSAAPPLLATTEVIAPIAPLATNTATTTALIARNAVCGSSPRRRAAISAAGRAARRAVRRAATAVTHGPATTSPIMIETMPAK